MKYVKERELSPIALKQLNPEYENEGFVLLKFKNHQDKVIDIIYHLDYEKFSQKYQDGFSKILRLDEIKKDLEAKFKTKVELKPLEKFNV